MSELSSIPKSVKLTWVPSNSLPNISSLIFDKFGLNGAFEHLPL